MKYLIRYLLLSYMAVMLSACIGPKTPQEVTEAFWEAVIKQDAGSAIKYSTLTDSSHYDGFDKQWAGYSPTWGKVVIDGSKASVVSVFAGPANTDKEDRKFATYLVKQNDVWLVDYDRTAVEVKGGALTNLFGKLGKLGDEISKQLQASADGLSDEMQRIGKELEKMSDEFSNQATDTMERYAENLRGMLRELEDSINRALKDDSSRLSDQDRKTLEEASAEVVASQDHLAKPTLDSFASASKRIGNAQEKLAEVENDSLGDYRQQWQSLSQQLERQLQKVIDDIKP